MTELVVSPIPCKICGGEVQMIAGRFKPVWCEPCRAALEANRQAEHNHAVLIGQARKALKDRRDQRYNEHMFGRHDRVTPDCELCARRVGFLLYRWSSHWFPEPEGVPRALR